VVSIQKMISRARSFDRAPFWGVLRNLIFFDSRKSGHVLMNFFFEFKFEISIVDFIPKI